MNFSLEDLKKKLKSIKKINNKEEEIKKYIKNIESNKKALEKNYMSILELQKVYVFFCEFYLEKKNFEKALFKSEQGLLFKEDEDLRVINFLCLKKLKMTQKSNACLKIGLENFPQNSLFKKNKKYLENKKNQRNNQNGNLKNNLNGNLNGNFNKNINFNNNNISQKINNLDENQISSMVNMMKNNPQSKKKMEEFYGRSISDAEYNNMIGMMNGDMIKTSLEMYKNNPELLKNFQKGKMNGENENVNNKNQSSNNKNFNINSNTNNINKNSKNPQFGNMPNKLLNNMMTEDNMKMAMDMMKNNPDLIKNFSQNRNMPNMNNPNLANMNNDHMKSMMTEDNMKMAMDMMKNNPDLIKNFSKNQNLNNSNLQNFNPQNGNTPNLKNIGILENKNMIKTGLKMFKDNPKQILNMMKGVANNPHIDKIADISESKLKIMSNCLYYFITFILEAFSLGKKFKNEIIVFLIFYFIYKIMGN